MLQQRIDIELWETARKNYEAENYTGAIVDSIFKLTDTIRNKTGLEGDGASLIGQAFGGENPKIKINKLQTDSEKDVQRGIQEILRGIYTAIRNPRSHDAIHDTKSDADAIIIFVNYLLNLVDKSKLSFEEEDFLKRVFDPYYVKSKEYSDLLIQEIPKRQRANIAISTILKKEQGDIESIGCFLASLLDQLDDSELSRVYSVISNELRITVEEIAIRYFTHICPGKYWGKIEKAVRLRTESILYEDFTNASFDVKSGKCGNQGALATWITADHFKQFDDLAKWTSRAIVMRESNDHLKGYIAKFFWESICNANKHEITYPLRHYFKQALIENNVAVIERLKDIITWEENHPWWKVFEEELKHYPDIEPIGLPF